MANMIEAAPPLRSMHQQEEAGWMRYIFSSAVGIAVFGAMLWVAS